MDLFADVPYAGVTMTEIAERSGTAIGSLYRFFPSKAHVANAVLAEYGLRIETEFEALRANACTRSAAENAADLIRLITALGRYRAAGIALIDAQDNDTTERHRIRQTMRLGIAGVLERMNPQEPDAERGARGVAILQLLKAVANHHAREGAAALPVAAELERMLAFYLDRRHARPD